VSGFQQSATVQIEQIQSQEANQETNFGRAPGGMAGGRQNIQGGRNSMIDIFSGNRADVNYLIKSTQLSTSRF
jgi:hypothetical protein